MNNNKKATSALLCASILLFGAAGTTAAYAKGKPVTPTPSQWGDVREQDSRSFTPVVAPLPALAAFPDTQRFTGVHQNASYQIEVPQNWNGMLVMYAHGYRGTGSALTVGPPAALRPWLLDNGYAWAASSYSRNYYDVRAGVEDTNALALAFSSITGQEEPGKIYITGHSMGGHVAAAAVEAETLATANNPVQYAGSVPMCGVTGDTYEFEYLANFTFAAQHLAGLGPTSYPATDFQTKLPQIQANLWTVFPFVPNEQGLKLENIVRDLSGGERPIFAQGFRSLLQFTVMSTGGGDGRINGILAKPLTGNQGVRYNVDGQEGQNREEREFNKSILRVIGHPPANGMRDDGLRWIPVVNGEFDVPVVSIHTLGDLYVPFKHMQIHRERAEANGSDDLLVQRAIRAPSHCDFSAQEQVQAFADMLNWEQNGIKPAGDEVLDAEVVADPNYGCAFTTPERSNLPACSAGL
ncbi:alpha/beta hydrolase [Halopseudomonas nanhaiensis]|uniref:alpha/beta hydrolase n=1 Tax=Halopseudomonas nanhaiensis TaxID=2830842 RepID=UPI001CBF411B|nr:alpha/beta hydrolase [Halopseudomonas nanhaiensis]UAW99653.1 alpha/beta hydrolase [Halopseudomonas nanhaiensis]